MKNLEEYISRYKQFKKGNYEYKSITSPHALKEVVEAGKKIVFIGGHVNTSPFFLIGFILLIILFDFSILISSTIFETTTIFSVILITVEISSIPCGIFFGLGLWYKRSRYIIVGPEGIAYKKRTHRVRGYNWGEIKMNYSFKIYISLPNGDYLKVQPSNYSCKELSQSKAFVSKATLLMYIFAAYYDYGKTGIFNWQPQAINNVIDTDMVIIDAWKDQLKVALDEYKKKRYNYGNYITRAQLRDDFLKKKIFVLKGGLGIGTWCIISFPLLVVIIVISFLNPLYGTFNMSEVLFIIIFTVLFWSFICSPLFLILRRFLVISSSGVYYRIYGKKSYFSWDEIVKIKRSKKDGLRYDFAVVDVFLLSRRIRFASNQYKNREFPKKSYVDMFFNLFILNAQLRDLII